MVYSTYYFDFPSELAKMGSRYYRCKSCKENSSTINGELDGHLENCNFRRKIYEMLELGYSPKEAIYYYDEEDI